MAALAAGAIAGAALDVTDPEPLPDGHPLWREPRALITPHVANPDATLRRYLAELVRENVARFARRRASALADRPGRRLLSRESSSSRSAKSRPSQPWISTSLPSAIL